MKDIQQKGADFLTGYRMNYDSVDIKKCGETFMNEMDAGLAGDESDCRCCVYI